MLKVLTFIVILLLFQGTLENFIPLFKYMDELLILVLFIRTLYIIFICKEKLKYNILEMFTIGLLGLIFLIGIYSNINYNITSNLKNYFMSMILFFKPFLLYFLLKANFQNIKFNRSQLENFSKLLTILILIYTLIIITNIPFQFLKTYGLRYGISVVGVGFSHPAELDFLVFALISIKLYLDEFLQKKSNQFNYLLACSFIIIIFTGRSKALFFYIAFLGIYLLIKFNKKLNIWYLFTLIPVLIATIAKRFFSEFLRQGSARGTLYTKSICVAKDFFPLGSGFGTFGTEYSRIDYSPLYYYYNMNTVYGLTPTHPAFITDAHWAGVIAELGFIGSLLYLLVIIILTYIVFSFSNKKFERLALLLIWGYTVFCSLSDTILTSYRGLAAISVIILLSKISIDRLEE